jgi:hypothetical protein
VACRVKAPKHDPVARVSAKFSKNNNPGCKFGRIGSGVAAMNEPALSYVDSCIDRDQEEKLALPNCIRNFGFATSGNVELYLYQDHGLLTPCLLVRHGIGPLTRLSFAYTQKATVATLIIVFCYIHDLTRHYISGP